jgi:predicted acyl esterase
MKIYLFFILYLTIPFGFSQHVNGIIDDPRDLTTGQTINFTMKDGTNLSTDIFLPITQDSMLMNLEIKGYGKSLIQIIPKGIQYLIYDSINGDINPNPYQLPIVFSRTPYNKSSAINYGSFVSLIGFAYAMQDMRGAYASEGAYLPMYSDGWNKNSYHPDLHHLLDITESTDPRNANKHEDGYESVKYIIDSLKRTFDFNRDGTIDTFLVTKGNIGMFGASALANSQYTAAAAHKIFPDSSGLKSLFAIVGTADLQNSALTQNGVYREALVGEWISNQISTINNVLFNNIDDGLNDTIHSFSDYNLETASQAIDLAIKTMIDSAINDNLPGYYPNSPIRASMDVSFAPVDSAGEGEIDGQYSRFQNMDVPAYHLTGWWDIFIDGQIHTFNQMRNNLSGASKNLQKLVIGPWAHQTISQRTTGDITYPENVSQLLKLDISDLENISESEDNIFDSELYKWFRHTLNHNVGYNNPKFIIPESSNWQTFNASVSLRIPSADYKLPYNQFIEFISGNSPLDSVPVEMAVNGDTGILYYSFPELDSPFFNSNYESNSEANNYFDDIPAIRCYVPGPVDDGIAANNSIGNYWMSVDSFPFSQNISYKDFYLQQNNILDIEPPLTIGELSYESDPDNPVLTVGGANMTIKTPDDNRRSQGQINLADPDLIDLTMNHAGVINFTSQEIQDSLSIIGIPKATLYAKSEVPGFSITPTNTDFFIRILDVYPDGREFFVVEGAVNARAREYALSIFNDNPNPEAQFSNILSDQYYEYNFNLMPIAYTFGHKHRLKILISSSNYPRYMATHNLPLNGGEFFRRQPNDNQTYNFDGEPMTARVVTNTIAFSPEMESKIALPVFGDIQFTSINKPSSQESSKIRVFPNPAHNQLIISPANNERYNITIMEINGKIVLDQQISGQKSIDISNLPEGIYIIQFIGKTLQENIRLIKI